MARVADGKVVVVHYTLKSDDGVVIESTHGREPMAYLHGAGNLVSGVEKALAGQEIGAKLSVVVPPAEGYGERKSPGPQEVPRREFPRKTELREGMPLQIADSSGNPVVVWVTKIQGSRVWIDTDHPLAGKTLHFDFEILYVRDPYPEEIQHGHAHGAHGHERH